MIGVLRATMFEFPSGRFSIFLTDLHEPEDNALRIVVAEANALPDQTEEPFPHSSIAPIAIMADSRRFEFVWNDYIAYLVRNESFALSEKEGSSGIFLERKASIYLRFLEETTFATSVIKKPMLHWSIICLNHCIDVVSFSKPMVREIDGLAGEARLRPNPN